MSSGGWQILGRCADLVTVGSLLVAAGAVVRVGLRNSRRRNRLFLAGLAAVVVALAGTVAVHLAHGGADAWQAAWSTVTAALTLWFAASREVWLAALARTSPAARRTRRRTIDAQDEIVQSLVVATIALDVGDPTRARSSVEHALQVSRGTLSDLLDGRIEDELVRARAAAVRPVPDDPYPADPHAARGTPQRRAGAA